MHTDIASATLVPWHPTPAELQVRGKTRGDSGSSLQRPTGTLPLYWISAKLTSGWSFHCPGFSPCLIRMPAPIFECPGIQTVWLEPRAVCTKADLPADLHIRLLLCCPSTSTCGSLLGPGEVAQNRAFISSQVMCQMRWLMCTQCWTQGEKPGFLPHRRGTKASVCNTCP